MLVQHGVLPYLGFAVGPHEQDAGLLQLSDDEPEQVDGWLICPVEIIENEYERLFAGDPAKEDHDCVKETESRLGGIQWREGRALGRLGAELGSQVSENRFEALRALLKHLRAKPIEEGPQDLDPGPEGRRTLCLGAARD